MAWGRAGLDKVGEVATEAIGDAAGTTVDPAAGAQQASSWLTRPSTLLTLALIGAAYVAGRAAR